MKNYLEEEGEAANLTNTVTQIAVKDQPLKNIIRRKYKRKEEEIEEMSRYDAGYNEYDGYDSYDDSYNDYDSYEDEYNYDTDEWYDIDDVNEDDATITCLDGEVIYLDEDDIDDLFEGKKVKKVVRNGKVQKILTTDNPNQMIKNGKVVQKTAADKMRLKKAAKKRVRKMKGRSKTAMIKQQLRSRAKRMMMNIP